MSALQVIWFILVAVLLAVYAVLDGFDLGVGIWHLFAKGDGERRSLMGLIGPVWDGNEVWLLTGGGALFAAFPHVYATVFSAMYLPLMLVLFGLILRAVSIKFRSMEEAPVWRRRWDVAFSVGSALPALLFGVAVGNILRGLPVGITRNFEGTLLTLLNPYALLIGVTGFAMLAMHGALFIALRTEGQLMVRANIWAGRAWLTFISLLGASFAASLFLPQLRINYLAFPPLWILPVIVLGLAFTAGVMNMRQSQAKAFLASSLTVLGTMALVMASMFPRMVYSLGRPGLSLTVANASSSEKTLGVMLLLAIIGMPIVIGYTIWAYRAFFGKAGAASGY
jgi:cytochrome bd ubiquinol oxidase subunit II